MRAGRRRICQQSRTSIGGPTASIWRPGSSSRGSASWSSSARRLRARRNSSASTTGPPAGATWARELVLGVTREAKKQLIGFADVLRESSQSWRDLLLDLKRRGLKTAPQIAVADGALGFWKALGGVGPTHRAQRWRGHKHA